MNILGLRGQDGVSKCLDSSKVLLHTLFSFSISFFFLKLITIKGKEQNNLIIIIIIPKQLNEQDVQVPMLIKGTTKINITKNATP